MRKARIKNIDDAAKALGVKDVSEISSEHALKFIPLLPRMDKEVAQQLLKLCPDLIQITPEVIGEFEKLSEQALKHNAKGNEAVLEAYKAVIEECQKALAKGKLSYRKKKKLLDMMEDVADKMAAHDEKNKDFIKGIHDVGEKCGLAALGVIATLIGVILFRQPPQKQK